MKYVSTLIFTFATGAVIVLVNYIMKIVLKKLSKFERYDTLTKEYRGTAIKLFVVMFINTALITLIVIKKYFFLFFLFNL